MHMIPNISEFDNVFYEDAKKRMKKLVDRAMGSDTEIVTQFFGKNKKKARFAFYRKINNGKIALSTKDYWIRFLNAKNIPSSLPFLCFQLWDIFQEEKYAVHRYVYFEIHYIDGIFGVLMKHSRFSAPNTGFDEFDLDRREWALAKQQMELWKEHFRPDIYHIKDWSKQKDILYHIFSDDYDEYRPEVQKDVKEIDYPFVDVFKGDDNQMIVFTLDVFKAMTKDKQINPVAFFTVIK